MILARAFLPILPAVLGAAAADAQTQVLGPWTISAPDSAVLVAGGGPTWALVNFVPAFVSVQDAFTGLPVQADGYYDLQNGTIVEVNFVGGVTNRPGEDILFVANHLTSGVDTAFLSSEYDGFSFQWGPVYAGYFIEYRDLRYWEPALGIWIPRQYAIGGYALDISFLGVPIGATVQRLRFRIDSYYGGGTYFALARIETPPVQIELYPDPPLAGLPARVAVTEASPGNTVGIVYSLFGPGTTVVNAGTCGPLTLGLSQPIRILALGLADAYGSFAVSGVIPTSLRGRSISLQGLDFATCTLSNTASYIPL